MARHLALEPRANRGFPMPTKSRSQVTRSIMLEGVTMTISLEEPVWRDLEALARDNDLTVAEVVSLVEDRLFDDSRLSSALSAYVSDRVRH